MVQTTTQLVTLNQVAVVERRQEWYCPRVQAITKWVMCKQVAVADSSQAEVVIVGIPAGHTFVEGSTEQRLLEVVDTQVGIHFELQQQQGCLHL